MPWKESRIVDQRLQFLSSYQKEEMSVSELCREFGVSRPTGYRWINRYKGSGPEGLLNLSSKPHSCSHATSEVIENAILAHRGKYPSWGARKLKAKLEQLDSNVGWPVASTFGNILQRAGLRSPRRKKRHTTPYSEPFSEVIAANELWCMDFKDYFATGDGSRSDPFTITDAHSRYLIRCQIVSRMDLSQVRAVCEAAMREYEMPSRIRTDNGAPFAGTGLLGLSKLSLGWMKMGIVHERIQPGRPQQNRRHERMHRTLKEEITKLAAPAGCANARARDRPSVPPLSIPPRTQRARDSAAFHLAVRRSGIRRKPKAPRWQSPTQSERRRPGAMLIFFCCSASRARATISQ
jgi:transposase InsO family protein